ncbi:dihydroorotase [Propioniferax innocua]|uniref:Dihydroorotase n=1 Tax=Propioniferax innocua TaxID=1753 RepID=A0A542ZRI0_9ACTN|nr:dihydroorotase [Propioniferax innocua]TQL62968.1 dihydroorotase [Propioniferax innocua]
MTRDLLLTQVGLPDGTTADLAISAGRLVEPGDVNDPQRVDAAGLTALPGLVDPHTHLREPGREDAETIDTGTRAAARGGFTAVCAMANTNPVTDTGEQVAWLHQAARGASAQVVPIGAVTKGLKGEELAELALMARAGVRMFSDDGKCVHDARLMRRALEYLGDVGGVIAQHAQDPRLAGPGACCHEGEVSGRLGLAGWPAVAESVIVARDVQLAQLTGTPVHVCHVSTAETVEVLRWAKAKGMPVTAEVTPHHLMLTVAEVEGYDPTYKVNPPLRTEPDLSALADALVDGTIDMIGTDHAPHADHDKAHAFSDAAFGMLGLEQALAVVVELFVNTGRLDWAGVAERMSHAPARLARITEQGRPLRIGEPANLCLVDPTARATVDRAASASLSRNNPWHGRDLPDPVVGTLWRGEWTYAQEGLL